MASPSAGTARSPAPPPALAAIQPTLPRRFAAPPGCI